MGLLGDLKWKIRKKMRQRRYEEILKSFENMQNVYETQFKGEEWNDKCIRNISPYPVYVRNINWHNEDALPVADGKEWYQFKDNQWVLVMKKDARECANLFMLFSEEYELHCSRYEWDLAGERRVRHMAQAILEQYFDIENIPNNEQCLKLLNERRKKAWNYGLVLDMNKTWEYTPLKKREHTRGGCGLSKICSEGCIYKNENRAAWEGWEKGYCFCEYLREIVKQKEKCPYYIACSDTEEERKRLEDLVSDLDWDDPLEGVTLPEMTDEYLDKFL